MIKNTSKSYNSDNRGSAIITGLVVSTVLMVLCLSLLLVAYSLFFSTSQSTSDLPNREMLYSAAEALEHELLDYTLVYEAGTEPTLPTDRNLWNYIYENIWKGFNLSAENKYIQDLNNNYWLYFDSNDSSGNHSDLEKCSKYFYLTSIGSAKIIVQLYWELPKDFDETNIENKNGTLLNAIYRLYDNKGNLLVKSSKKYILKIELGTTDTDEQPPTSGDINLYTSVNKNESVTLKINKNQNGCDCNIQIINNTGNPIKDWYLIVVTNIDLSKVISSGEKVEKVDGKENTYKIRPSGEYDIIWSNKTISFNDNLNTLEFTPYLIEYNNIIIPHNGSGSGSSNPSTIKWTRIGEDIINPGGGN